mmetsp:Transcript_40206/g.101219  ORF Transcript_40206/g.101219 Transcript_40206/m.101219 type:complete len:240 (+) Transcript_40206:70-789(+)
MSMYRRHSTCASGDADAEFTEMLQRTLALGVRNVGSARNHSLNPAGAPGRSTRAGPTWSAMGSPGSSTRLSGMNGLRFGRCSPSSALQAAIQLSMSSGCRRCRLNLDEYHGSHSSRLSSGRFLELRNTTTFSGVRRETTPATRWASNSSKSSSTVSRSSTGTYDSRGDRLVTRLMARGCSWKSKFTLPMACSSWNTHSGTPPCACSMRRYATTVATTLRNSFTPSGVSSTVTLNNSNVS